MIVIVDSTPFRVRTLRDTDAVSVERCDHPPGARLPEIDEQAPAVYEVNIVERGWFRLRYGRAEHLLGPGSVFLARPGESYTFGHFSDVEADVCMSIAYRGVLADAVQRTFRRLPLVPPPTNRQRYLWLELQRTTTALGVESIACELADAVKHARDGCHLYRPQQLKWYAQRIHAAREEIDGNVAAQHSLWQLSSAVAMSPFAFARIFRELVGLPPHRYLLRRRLQRARTLLESGMAVTDACFEVGFNNLSHFTRTYQRHFGALPSSVKRHITSS